MATTIMPPMPSPALAPPPIPRRSSTLSLSRRPNKFMMLYLLFVMGTRGGYLPTWNPSMLVKLFHPSAVLYFARPVLGTDKTQRSGLIEQMVGSSEKKGLTKE